MLEKIRLQKQSTKLKLFPPQTPLQYVAIDLLGQLIKNGGNCFLLIIFDSHKKLVRFVPLKQITATTVARAFATHWVFSYGAPELIISDNGKQFTCQFFQNLFKILGTIDVFTNTRHPQTNGMYIHRCFFLNATVARSFGPCRLF